MGPAQLASLPTPDPAAPEPGGGAVPAGNLERLLPGRPVAPLSPGWEPAHPGVALHLVPQPVAGPLLPRGSPSFPAVFRLYPAGASAQPCLFPHHEGSPVGAVPKCSGKSPSSSSAKRHGGACDGGQCLRLSHGPPLPGGRPGPTSPCPEGGGSIPTKYPGHTVQRGGPPAVTLTFITNYLTHHTSPLSEALYGWLGAGFHFVETRPLRAGRVELHRWWNHLISFPYYVF